MGLSTAYALLKQGQKRVTVLEQATVDHERAASHGPTRLLRFEYGNDLLYSQMVGLSLQHWKKLEKTAQRTLYAPTGLLVLGAAHDPYPLSSYTMLRDLGYMPEKLTRRTCQQRFPQFYLQDYDQFIYNREAGMLHASLCLLTLKECIQDMGGIILEQHQVRQIHYNTSTQPLRLYLAGGDVLSADRLVLAAGPWIHRLLGELHLPIRLTRQYLLYFAQLADTRFSRCTFPAFIAGDLYGFPMYNAYNAQGSGWLKAASHTFGPTVDPDAFPTVDERVINLVREQLQGLLPDLEDAELAHVDSCIYDVSPDEHFILDHHPEDARIVFATGLSGHGFKFGLVLGELLSSLVCETQALVPLERFRLSRLPWHAHSVA